MGAAVSVHLALLSDAVRVRQEAVYNEVIQEQQFNFPTQNGVRFHMFVDNTESVCLYMMPVEKTGWYYFPFLRMCI